MANGNNNGHHRNGTGNGLVHSPPRTGYGVNGNGHRPETAHAPVKAPEIVPGHDLSWDGLSPAVTGALGQPLDPALVSQRKGRSGRTFSYIEGHVAISEANRVFGFGGWGYELVADVTLREIENVDPHTGEIRHIRAYSAPVRVTVPGAPPRTDIGFHAVTEETAEGHETALKGAVTDGLKRALRSFGDRFGNGLYGNQHPVNSAPRPERVPAQVDAPGNRGRRASSTRREANRAPGAGVPGNHHDRAHLGYLRRRLIELGVAQGFDEDQVRTAVTERMGKGLDDLTAQELTPLVESATRKAHLAQQPQAA